MPRYFIYWKNLATNYCSHGQCIFENETTIKKAVIALNKKHSNKIIHKYEEKDMFDTISYNQQLENSRHASSRGSENNKIYK